MLLKGLVVRSTTQKDESLSVFVGLVLVGLRQSEDELVSLAWNGQEICIAIEGIVAHGPGGIKRTFMVL